MLIVALGAMLLALRPPTGPVPAASPSPGASQPEPTPTQSLMPSPTVLPTPSATSPLAGISAVSLPAGSVCTVTLPIALVPASGGPPQGPYVCLGAEPMEPSTRTLMVADLGGSERAVPVPLQEYEAIDSARADEGILVVMVWRRDPPVAEHSTTPCSSASGQPVAWRLLSVPLGSDGLPSGAWHELDHGVATRQFRYPTAGIYCDDPLVPATAVSSGLVAYAVERPTPELPAGSSVVVRSLATGAIVREVTTETAVVHLARSATTLAWVKSPNALVAGTIDRWRIMRAPLATGDAQEITVPAAAADEPLPAQAIALDGDAVLAQLGGKSSGAFTIRAAGSSVEVLNPVGSRECRPVGASGPVTILGCFQPGTAQQFATDDHLATWSAARGLRVIANAPGALLRSEQIVDGWEVWQMYDASGRHLLLSGVPLKALVALDGNE